MREAFGRERRLLTRSDYQYVFDAPEKRSSDRYFTVLGRFCARDNARLGLIMAKKKVARAHERNRLKRLTRETFRRYFAQDNAQAVDIIVLAKHQAQFADNVTLHNSLNRHWQRMQP